MRYQWDTDARLPYVLLSAVPQGGAPIRDGEPRLRHRRQRRLLHANQLAGPQRTDTLPNSNQYTISLSTL